MPFLIDTNIAIHARDGDAGVLAHFARHDGAIVLSALSLAELLRGVFRDPPATLVRSRRLQKILEYVPVLPFDTAAANAYGQIIMQLGWVRSRDFDRMIAGHAISSHSVLVTANMADFRDIPGLTLEDWSTP